MEIKEVRINANPAADNDCLQCIMSKGHFCAENNTSYNGKCVGRKQAKHLKVEMVNADVEEDDPENPGNKIKKLVEKKGWVFDKLKDEWESGVCENGRKPITAIGRCGSRYHENNTNAVKFANYKAKAEAAINDDSDLGKQAIKHNNRYAIKRATTWIGAKRCDGGDIVIDDDVVKKTKAFRDAGASGSWDELSLLWNKMFVLPK